MGDYCIPDRFNEEDVRRLLDIRPEHEQDCSARDMGRPELCRCGWRDDVSFLTDLAYRIRQTLPRKRSGG